MMLIGCDFHPSWQQVNWLDTETEETGERKLVQASGDAERFYRQVAAPALIGMEATGNSHWLVDLLSELGQLWVGDAAQIRASYVRQQKTDKRDAAHILKLLVEGRFPRIWMPSSEVRDQRQLLLHRYKLVIIRARVQTQGGVSTNGAVRCVVPRGDVRRRARGTEGASYLAVIPRELLSRRAQNWGDVKTQGQRVLRMAVGDGAQRGAL